MAGGEAAGRWVAICSSLPRLRDDACELARADLEARRAGGGPAGGRIGDDRAVDADAPFADQARRGALRLGEPGGDDQIDELVAAGARGGPRLRGGVSPRRCTRAL